MIRTGRPVNTGGNVYQRRDSSVWWMSYRDQEGRFRQESTGQKDRDEAEKVLRKRLVARDEGTLPQIEVGGQVTFDEWANWFVEYRCKPPFRAQKTYLVYQSVLKFLRPRFGKMRLSEITADQIEAYLRKRLSTGKRVHTKFGLQLRGKLKPATVHQEYRVLQRILNVAVKKRRVIANPCNGVEFPVALAGSTRKPHYVTATEQARI